DTAGGAGSLIRDSVGASGGCARAPAGSPCGDSDPSVLEVVEALADATQALAKDLDLRGAREAILEIAQRLLAANKACVYESFEDGSGVRLAASRGVAEDLAQNISAFSADAPSLVTRAARTRRIQLVRPEDHGELTDVCALYRQGECRLTIAIPIS